jgi:hypothetical protein
VVSLSFDGSILAYSGFTVNPLLKIFLKEFFPSLEQVVKMPEEIPRIDRELQEIEKEEEDLAQQIRDELRME